MLLEKKDWNNKGQYIPNIDKGTSEYDLLLMIRIKPSCEDLLKQNMLLYSDAADSQSLFKLVSEITWEYELTGFITRDDLKQIINNRFLLYRGSLLNGKTTMDADNYYVQAGDLRDLSEWENSVQKKENKD